MPVSRLHTALCVAVLVVSFMTWSVTAVSLWSRLKQRLYIDRQVYKREMVNSHHMDMDDISDKEHGVKMGVPLRPCDDGMHGIEIDWDTGAFTCDISDIATLQTESPPFQFYKKSTAPVHHICLKKSIVYDSPIPTSGDHRPLWPKFGEYNYLPPQRWVHSLEHGAIVLLYHPCMAQYDVDSLHRMKKLLKGCLTKYIITPYSYIPNNRPFALLAFEHAMLVSKTDNISELKKFIKDYALNGTETHVLKDGQYKYGWNPDTIKVSNDILQTC